MALRIELEADKPGVAKLVIQKWSGNANVDILVQRNQDGYYLADGNQWTAETHWHNVPNLLVDNDKLEGPVTEWLVDALLSQENRVRFLMTVREHQHVDQPNTEQANSDQQNDDQKSQAPLMDRGVMNISEKVLASSALDPFATPRVDQSINHLDSDNAVTQLPAIEPVLPPLSPEELLSDPAPLTDDIPIEPVNEQSITDAIEDEPVITVSEDDKDILQPIKTKKRVGLIAIFVILLLLILAGLSWYFLWLLNRNSTTDSQSPSQSITGCALSDAGDDDLAFIQKCLQNKPDTAAILSLINEAKAANKCNIAQRLYANQAQQNASIAMIYAQEYDDKFYQPNDCFKTDKDTAAYWYETALALDPNNANSALAKERLAELKNSPMNK
ncbi:hypothetical protein PT273_01995 [Orbaceae bacterium ESL0727]|nr:hypothetical protein [Orbaceae bacterium ESL0727]